MASWPDVNTMGYIICCPICYGDMRDAKILPCGHCYCLRCLEILVRMRGSDTPKVTCLTCRTVTFIPENGVAGLPTYWRAPPEHGKNLNYSADTVSPQSHLARKEVGSSCRGVVQSAQMKRAKFGSKVAHGETWTSADSGYTSDDDSQKMEDLEDNKKNVHQPEMLCPSASSKSISGDYPRTNLYPDLSRAMSEGADRVSPHNRPSTSRSLSCPGGPSQKTSPKEPAPNSFTKKYSRQQQAKRTGIPNLLGGLFVKAGHNNCLLRDEDHEGPWGTHCLDDWGQAEWGRMRVKAPKLVLRL